MMQEPVLEPATLYQWLDLAPWWSRIIRLSSSRHLDAASTRPWNEHRDVIGVAGEKVFAVRHGLAMEWENHWRGGDPGYDFVIAGKTVDVKATGYTFSPHLLMPVADELRADWYALTAVDVGAQRGYYVGMVPRAVLEAAPVQSWGPLGVPTRVLPYEIVRGWPT